MMTPLFIATERFDPSNGEAWKCYLAFAKIPGLTEIVSLDSMLCPPLISEFVDEDWKHNVHADCRLGYFHDMEYLLGRIANISRKNVLGLYRNPESHIAVPPALGGFTFVGYDLVEDMTQISAITNCGGFPETFSNDELNQFGLLSSFDRAAEVQRLLPECYLQEHHAQCELYAIWRLT